MSSLIETSYKGFEKTGGLELLSTISAITSTKDESGGTPLSFAMTRNLTRSDEQLS